MLPAYEITFLTSLEMQKRKTHLKVYLFQIRKNQNAHAQLAGFITRIYIDIYDNLIITLFQILLF